MLAKAHFEVKMIKKYRLCEFVSVTELSVGSKVLWKILLIERIISMDKIKQQWLTDGDTMEINVPNIKRDYQISFYGKIIKTGVITVGHGFTAPWTSAFVEIDDENVRVFAFYAKKELLAELSHGLTIRDFISVTIRVKSDATATLILTSVTGSFEHTIVWNGGFGPVKAIMSDGELRDCSLQFYGEAFDKPNWGFGDSYFDIWPQFLSKFGANNWLLDGGSGRGSVAALASLVKALRYRVPKCIFWCMGMNDADTKDRINESWKEAAEKLIGICNQYQIELILTTVPNVPERCHGFKNDYVRKSGYRYVDLSEAVGAEETTEWYEGLLGQDRVHPTDMGAKVIAMRVLAEVPELLKME